MRASSARVVAEAVPGTDRTEWSCLAREIAEIYTPPNLSGQRAWGWRTGAGHAAGCVCGAHIQASIQMEESARTSLHLPRAARWSRGPEASGDRHHFLLILLHCPS